MPPTRPAAAPFPRSLVATPYRIGVLALVITTMSWRAWTVSRWTWQDDDWLYMDGTHDLGFVPYLLQDYNGHVMPGGFLISWVVTKVAPLDFRVPVAVVTVACGVLVFVWARTLARLVGEHIIVLAPLALLALTPLMIRPTVWWASSLQAVPLQFFIALTTLLAARVARDPLPGDRWRLALLFLAALAFWQKSILLLLPITAILIHLGAGPLRRRLRVAAAHLWPTCVVALVYVSAFLTYTSGKSSSNSLEIDTSSVSASDAAEFFARGLTEILVPALLGGPWGTLPTDSDPWIHQSTGISFLFGLCAVMGALYLVTRVREGWLLLGCVLSYVLAAWGLILFSSRFQLSGQATSTTERFHVDSFAVTVVLLTLALAGLGAPSMRRWLASPLTSTILLVALAMSLVISNGWQARRIGTSPAKPWVAAVNSSVPDAGPVSLLDTSAPGTVLPGFWLEYAHITNMLAVLPNVSFGTPAPQLQSVLQSGQLAPVEVTPDSRNRPGPVADCGYSVEPGRTVRVPMAQELFDWTWVVQLDTLSAEGGELTLRAGDSSVVMPVEPGLQSLQAPLSGTVGEAIELTMSSRGGTVCVAGVTIGNAITDNP